MHLLYTEAPPYIFLLISSLHVEVSPGFSFAFTAQQYPALLSMEAMPPGADHNF